MKKPPAPPPEDLKALADFLDARSDPDGPCLSYLELFGFLFALASVPEVIRPADWFDFVLGDEEAPTFSDEGEAELILSALVGLYNEVNAEVLERDVALPPECALRDEPMANLEPDAPIGYWCRGLLEGHDWLEDVWEKYLGDDESSSEMDACYSTLMFFTSRELAEAMLAEEGSPFDSLEEAAGVFHRLFPEAMAAYAALGRSIHEAVYRAEYGDPPPAEPFMATAPIERNDPCPCGSGKKFKKCCGKSVH